MAVDTTVMEKNIAHPSDVQLYERAWVLLVGLAKEAGIELRQGYARLAAQVGRYAHARQFKGYTGRIRRDLRRHLQDIPEAALRDRVLEALWRVGRLPGQIPKSRGKIHALHEPEVDCIAKGKARARYEFGTKASLATTIKERALSSALAAFPATLIMATPWRLHWSRSPS